MMENIITIANYDFDINLLYKTKKMASFYKNQILSDIVNHPNGLKVLIRLKKGDIILKSKKQNLLANKNKINELEILAKNGNFHIDINAVEVTINLPMVTSTES